MTEFDGGRHCSGRVGDERYQSVTADAICDLVRGGGPTMVFQPIVDAADLNVVGYEALSRFPTGTACPAEWFDSAAQSGLSGALEGAALLSALNEAASFPPGMFLAVNLSPAALTDDPLLAEPLRHAARHRRIILEVSERTHIHEIDTVLTRVNDLRDAGVVIALDDVGAGQSGLRQVITVRPEMIKIDAFITHDIDTDPLREAIAAGTVAIAEQFGMTVVFEGVETDAQLSTVRRLGAHLLQGVHLGCPTPAGDLDLDLHRAQDGPHRPGRGHTDAGDDR